MARRQSLRTKPKKKPNRYNPNRPDYFAVHYPGLQAPNLTTLAGAIPPMFRTMFGK